MKRHLGVEVVAYVLCFGTVLLLVWASPLAWQSAVQRTESVVFQDSDVDRSDTELRTTIVGLQCPTSNSESGYAALASNSPLFVSTCTVTQGLNVNFIPSSAEFLVAAQGDAMSLASGQPCPSFVNCNNVACCDGTVEPAFQWTTVPGAVSYHGATRLDGPIGVYQFSSHTSPSAPVTSMDSEWQNFLTNLSSPAGTTNSCLLVDDYSPLVVRASGFVTEQTPTLLQLCVGLSAGGQQFGTFAVNANAAPALIPAFEGTGILGRLNDNQTTTSVPILGFAGITVESNSTDNLGFDRRTLVQLPKPDMSWVWNFVKGYFNPNEAETTSECEANCHGQDRGNPR